MKRPHPAWCLPLVAAAFAGGWLAKTAPKPDLYQQALRLSAEQDAITEGLRILDSGDTSPTVYITRTGTKYHRASCQYAKTGTATTLDEAKAKGLTPCSKCKP